ncbi:MAG: hypothetical protein KFKLKKLM_01331 [Flavobacteriales bacterium]|nr:hypothetical protein [Flavobacteriales bacterium]
MKRNYKSILSLGLSVVLSTTAFAQAINEGFDDVTTLPAAGWAQQNLGTPVGTNPNWVQGNSTVFTANSGAATAFIAANYQSVSGAATISNWLFTPERTFTNGDVISFYTRTAGSFADNLQVRLSLNGSSVNAGTTNTSVGDFTTLLLEINPTLVVANYPTTWTQYSITISGLGAPTNGRIAFRYFVTDGGPSGSNSNYIGIDDYVYTPAGSPTAPDVAISTPNAGEYTIIPINQVTALPLGAKITNAGTDAATDAMLTVNVYQLPSTLVQTTSSTPTSIAIGANTVASAGTFTPSSVGDYYIEYIATATGNVNFANDTTAFIIQVDDSTYARDYANVTGVSGLLGIGAGAGQNSRLGQTFNLVNGDTLTSIDVFIGNTDGSLNGQPLTVHVYATAAGVPTTLLGSTDAFTMDTTTNTLWNLPITNGLALPAGVFAIAVEENDSNITIGNTTQIFTNNTVFVKWDGNASGAWTAVENFGASFSKPFVLRPNFGVLPIQTGVNELSNTKFSVYPNPTTENILVNGVVKGSTLEVVNALGQVVYTEVVSNTKTNVNVANYNNGLYMVRITNNGEVITNTFVKQ